VRDLNQDFLNSNRSLFSSIMLNWIIASNFIINIIRYTTLVIDSIKLNSYNKTVRIRMPGQIFARGTLVLDLVVQHRSSRFCKYNLKVLLLQYENFLYYKQ
jgi:hypothetical protein